MPKLSVWLIRLSLLHLGIGFTIGGVIMIHKGLSIYADSWHLLTAHIHIMIFGWIIQLVLGVAYYILPKFRATHRYGYEPLGWYGLVMLNGGIGLIIFRDADRSIANYQMMFGYLAILLAIGAFILLLWGRVKPINV